MIKSNEVRKLFSSLAQQGTTVQYVILGGNAGDALIDMGFFSLARETGLQFALTRLDEVEPSAPVIISGGGGLVSEWSSMGTRRSIETLHTRVKRLIILPQTIRGHEDLLRELGSNVTVFVRERASFAHATEYCKNGATVVLDHDMAFNLDARGLLASREFQLPRVRSVKDAIRLLLYGLAKIRSMLWDEINVERRDVERAPLRSRGVKIYNDLSFVSTFRGADQETITSTAHLLLSVIDGYKTVRSDRLHVCIGAYLLDKGVLCVDNSNSKVSGVYDYSLASSSNVRMSND